MSAPSEPPASHAQALDATFREMARTLGISDQQQEALRRALLDALHDLPQHLHHHLHSSDETGPEPAEAGSGVLHVKDVARRLGVSRSWAVRLLRQWSERYGIQLQRCQPSHRRSALYITLAEWRRVPRQQRVRKRPGQRRARKKRPRVTEVHADLLKQLHCPACGSMNIRCNATRRTKRYFKCLRCAVRSPATMHFAVRFD